MLYITGNVIYPFQSKMACLSQYVSPKCHKTIYFFHKAHGRISDALMGVKVDVPVSKFTKTLISDL